MHFSPCGLLLAGRVAASAPPRWGPPTQAVAVGQLRPYRPQRRPWCARPLPPPCGLLEASTPAHRPGKALSKRQQSTLAHPSSQFSPGPAEKTEEKPAVGAATRASATCCARWLPQPARDAPSTLAAARGGGAYSRQQRHPLAVQARRSAGIGALAHHWHAALASRAPQAAAARATRLQPAAAPWPAIPAFR